MRLNFNHSLVVSHVVILTGFVFLLTIKSFAQGSLVINPVRIILDDNKKKESVNLVNQSNDTTTYTISLVHKKMKEDGGFENVLTDDSIKWFADPYLRIFPRKVTLAPRERQVVAVQYLRDPKMPEGEYHSHIQFKEELDNKPLDIVNTNTDSSKLGVVLKGLVSLAIPVIIRTGSPSAGAFIRDISIENQYDSIQKLKLSINRIGNCSVYGDIKVEFIPAQGKPFEVMASNGVGVYTEISKRNFVLILRKSPAELLKNGKLKIRYMSQDVNKPILYAEAEIEIK